MIRSPMENNVSEETSATQELLQNSNNETTKKNYKTSRNEKIKPVVDINDHINGIIQSKNTSYSSIASTESSVLQQLDANTTSDIQIKKK
jgi:hypothetical protein